MRHPRSRTATEQESRQAALRSLAIEFLQTPDPLAPEIGWLCTQLSFDVYQFGREVGQSDDEFKVLRSIIEAPPLASRSPFVRGYFDGLQANHPPEDKMTALLAEIESSSPTLALLFASSGLSGVMCWWQE